jgi:hypothetical protein
VGVGRWGGGGGVGVGAGERVVKGEGRERILGMQHILLVKRSVPDPPDPMDPHVVGPPRSGSISQSYGSGTGSGSGPGSGSFYHQAKIVRKTLIPIVLCLLLNFFIFKKLCKCTFKK